MSTLDDVLAALANPIRREAMRLLAGGGEMCLCEFMERLGVAQSSMSRHMSALRNAGLVIDRRDAQWVRYRSAERLAPELLSVLEAVLAAPEPEETTGRDRSAA